MKGRPQKERNPGSLAPSSSSRSSIASPELQPLAQSSTISEDDSSTRPNKTRRTILTTNACLRCRQRKTKCDGKHPVCARCQHDNVPCAYDVEQEGLTKMQSLQQQLRTRDRELQRVSNLLNMLAGGSDENAAEMLARLRLGETVDDILDRFNDQADATQTPRSYDSQESGGVSTTPPVNTLASRSAPATPFDAESGAPSAPIEGSFPQQDIVGPQQSTHHSQFQVSGTWEQSQWATGGLALRRTSYGPSSSSTASVRRMSTLESASETRTEDAQRKHKPEEQPQPSQSPVRSYSIPEAPVTGLRRSFWTGASPFERPSTSDDTPQSSDKRKR